MSDFFKIALAGNPNSGKSSLFNALTGLNQKVGNFPGVTVDKKTGRAQISADIKAKIIDLPGTYSLYPKSADEYVAYEVLLNPYGKDRPDLVVIVADAANLKRSLLFCSQIIDLKLPVILALSMLDIADSKGISVDMEALQQELGIPVVAINPRKNKGLSALKKTIASFHHTEFIPEPDFAPVTPLAGEALQDIRAISGVASDYAALHIASANDKIEFLTADQQQQIATVIKKKRFLKARIQAEEVMARYRRIGDIVQRTVTEGVPTRKEQFTERLDKILLHRVWGNVILLLVLFLMFQCVFWLASYPMSWIENGFAFLQGQAAGLLPEAWWSDLLVNGLLAGIGGVVIFIPQIALLFGIITLLEDSGYMARISFLTDRLMRSVGLNGRSVMPLISGMACAIPAVMAARTIENRKERLITILVTPFMSCSARLPIYTILIALVIPERYIFGIFNLQALVMMGMYLLGFVTALIVARILGWIMKSREHSIFLMEMPVYRAPRWKNALITMFEKAKIFVTDAGKVILVISLILWALASYGPAAKMDAVQLKYEQLAEQQGSLTEEQKEQQGSEKLEQSYAGIMGKAIEPAIRPLGYDWKMGIALISSFAAREVFVGTMATLYSVGGADENSKPLREKMHAARRADGGPVYTLATGLSLMVFYAFAMQCMSTIAIVKRETKSWKWPLIQLAYMTGLAYIVALLVYQLAK
ncbi:ferrous iron transport protein B [Taibaiella chishuiensis]|uniref:Ferrous iron transport protein B n=1 Tax=Taibaiella chishuiensis TaxID=1434707 RepID=A0A2P8DCR4_9BACT|nr:ferrous iron transport protein B [Taibaiella chishuiensis]PSK95021.1 ferrous iron transport protein B [Taibaiella chishuiensis]